MPFPDDPGRGLVDVVDGDSAASPDDVAVAPPGRENIVMICQVELLGRVLDGAAQPTSVVEADDFVVHGPDR